MTKVRPNEPCRCGSGRKFKKCCGAPGAPSSNATLSHTPADRLSVFAKLDAFIAETCLADEECASDLFWADHRDWESELSEELHLASSEVQETWFAFDYARDGVRVADRFLAASPSLRAGERAFVEKMRSSTMRLYEVTATVPGVSMTLRDLFEGSSVTVAERTASRTLARGEALAARVLARGCSGQPEMERGVLPIPAILRDALLAGMPQLRGAFLEEHPDAPLDAFYKQFAPVFHDAWLTAIFEPSHA